ncbi:MAG TPA: hypothetical protein VGO53_15295 [Steroidobacteraceae bacterium]|jgi:hypothetical protein|nr:hypothetical protein [Steroidobacteraceae bacterium]
MEAVLAGSSTLRSETRRFHVWMGGVFVLIAFGGFTPSYWSRVAQGTFHQPPVIHIHGILLFTWALFYLVQTSLVASGRSNTHRAWGLAGISLFSVVICSIVAAKITTMRLDELHGFGDDSRRFSAVTFLGLPLMIGLFAAAISQTRRPEVHKRLMLVLMAGLMTPASARVFLFLLAPPGALDGGPPPPWVSIPPAVVGILLVIAAMVYDWRTRGRPHKVYVYGVLLLALQPVLAVLIASTPAWMTAANFLQHLAG